MSTLQFGITANSFLHSASRLCFQDMDIDGTNATAAYCLVELPRSKIVITSREADASWHMVHRRTPTFQQIRPELSIPAAREPGMTGTLSAVGW